MIKQRKMVVSWDTYSWVHSLAGTIAKSPKLYEVIVVTKDSYSPICGCKHLCEEAIYAQRAYDLWKIGTEIGVRKLANMLYDEHDIDMEVLTAKLQMQVVLTGVKEVYFQFNSVLLNIFRAIQKKIDINLFVFDADDMGYQNVVYLDEHELNKKRDLQRYLVGTSHWVADYSNTERFYVINKRV
ncbi:MAG: hypothetical protein ACW98W_19870 [Candidatus Hodarchaeales archaeon]|jgi:hypothetical protein